MIIGISGKINSGKDTIAEIIQYLIWKNKVEKGEKINLHYTFKDFTNSKFGGNTLSNWEIKKFADKLKDIVCLLIGCTREQLEDREFREKELEEEWWYWKLERDGGYSTILLPYNESTGTEDYTLTKLTPRLLLQLLGTECGRKIIHPNLWVLTLMQDYKGDTEIWKPIENYENFYEISSFGRVRSLDRKIIYGEKRGEYHSRKGQILKPTLSGGYETVSLSNKTFTVHSLVAKHFVEGYQEGFVVNHIDYNKTNNFHKNLEWITQAENIQHNKTIIKGNFGEKQKDAKLTDEKVVTIKKLLEDGTFNQKQISDLFEVSPTTISDIKKGKKWNHVGKDIPVISPIIPIEYPNWIISDVRFPNELKAIKDKGGITIRVNRDTEYLKCLKDPVYFVENYIRTNKEEKLELREFDKDFIKKHCKPTKEHESETALDDAEFDYVIDNNGTIEELIQKVKEILIKEKLL